MKNKLVSDKAWCFYDAHGEPLPEELYPFSIVNKDKKLINYEMGISREGVKDIRWFLVNGFVIPDKTRDTERILISFIDITEKKQAEEALTESQALLKAAFETSQAGIVIVDAPSGKLRYVNKAGLLIRNRTEEEIQKDNDKLSYIKRWNLFHLDGTPYAEEEFILARAFLFGETRSDEFIIQRDDLENRYVLAHAAPIRNPMGVISAGVIVFLDITDKKKAEEGIQHLAYHDYLTDTYNRRFFENEYDSKNIGEYFPLVIVTGDLNGLKLINDSFGHYSGDYAIKQFAVEIQKRIPKHAILARVGGDEFSIILTRSSEEEARLLTGELQSNIRFGIKDNKGNDVGAELTATFGYSCQSFPGQGLDDLAKEAETFMYRRKFLESTSKRNNVIDAIMSTLFEKSEREQQHSLRVSIVATAIATAMGLDDTTVAKVRVAGSLHDIGKIGIDESILNKAEQLSDQEWELIKQHPIRSARILASVDDYLDIVPIVKAHHERIDGSGYPAGLSDKQIPIEAKIIAVADSFDAMTVSRPYRDAISKECAAEELKRCAGSQFDQEVVDAFLRTVLPVSDSFQTKLEANHCCIERGEV
jgi:diguanylate cyclase (GGDEF)-like protein/putative nucleotidyltransferase with HDIG domain/PAS domain S-box-containing protein